MAGVGKSALALTIAHALAGRYPDGHLFVDLHGHSEQEPATAHEAVGELLRQLGVGPRETPDHPLDRIALWRRRMREARAIVLLDNAAGIAQVQPLLPVDGASLILVTSRTRLAPIDGATSLSLDLLDPPDAVELLRLTADRRDGDDTTAVAAIVEICGRLPLAIQLVGHRLRHRPQWTLIEMLTQLSEARPAPIAVSAEGHSTGAAFDLSYRHLSAPQQTLFRRLGLHPAGAFEVRAAAALLDLTAPATASLLEDLVEANLVQADIPGRYRMHDLVRVFAESLVAEPERRTAILRLLDSYLHTLEAAGLHLEARRSDCGASSPPAQVFRTAAEGAAWTHDNWSTIVALMNLAEQLGAHRHTALLARMAYRSADVFGRSADALRLAERALAATDALGDDELTAVTHWMVGALYLRLGRNADCRASLERATRLYERLGDERMLYGMRVHTATLLRHEGRLLDAVRLCEEVIGLARAGHDRLGEVTALIECAAALHELGRHEPARLLLVDAIGDLRRRGTNVLGVALGYLGSVHIALDQPAAAAIALVWARNLKRQHGNVGGAAETLSDYGRLLARRGEPEAALRHQQQAYDQVRALGDGYFEPIIGNHLGQTLTILGRCEEAAAHHRRAIQQAQQRHWPHEQARGHAGLAAALGRTEPDRARAARDRAIAMFIAAGLHPEAAQTAASAPLWTR
jgi:tetratricopeptide (TPR) repeat protein